MSHKTKVHNGYIKAVRDTAMYLYYDIKESVKTKEEARFVTATIINEIAEEFRTGNFEKEEIENEE